MDDTTYGRIRKYLHPRRCTWMERWRVRRVQLDQLGHSRLNHLLSFNNNLTQRELESNRCQRVIINFKLSSLQPSILSLQCSFVSVWNANIKNHNLEHISSREGLRSSKITTGNLAKLMGMRIDLICHMKSLENRIHYCKLPLEHPTSGEYCGR